MNKLFFFRFIALLNIVYAIIGWRASRSIKTTTDYFLAGRHVGLLPLAIALAATQLGGGVIVGTSRESYSIGLWGLMYVFGISCGFMLLALGFASRMRSLGVSTTVEVFDTVFGSLSLRRWASLLSIVSLIGLFTAQVVASKNIMVSLDTFDETTFTLFWLFIIGYTLMGGLRAIVNNDVIQLGIIIIVFFCLFFYELFSNPGDVLKILSQTPTTTDSAAALGSWQRITSIMLIPALYNLIEQDVAQHIYAAKSPRTAMGGALIASVLMLCFAIVPVYFGMKAAALGIAIPTGGSPLIRYFDLEYHAIITMLVVYGVLAAIISTADALLCAVSSHVAQDFGVITRVRNPILAARSIMLVTGLVGLFLAHFAPVSIINLIVASYSLLIVALLVPLLGAYLGIVRKHGAAPSFWVGIGLYLTLTVAGQYGYIFDGNLIPEIGALIGSCAAYFLWR